MLACPSGRPALGCPAGRPVLCAVGQGLVQDFVVSFLGLRFPKACAAGLPSVLPPVGRAGWASSIAVEGGSGLPVLRSSPGVAACPPAR